jgi:hypothetical protein
MYVYVLSMKEKSTIQLNKETRSLLHNIGRKGQTYDEVINDLISKKNRLELLESQNGGDNHE